jgi:hypothetical protein
MKNKKSYEPPMVVDLKVDYTQAVGQSQCLTGGQASGQCGTGAQATSQCGTGGRATSACAQGPSARPQNCSTGNTAHNCSYGKSP